MPSKGLRITPDVSRARAQHRRSGQARLPGRPPSPPPWPLPRTPRHFPHTLPAPSRAGGLRCARRPGGVCAHPQCRRRAGAAPHAGEAGRTGGTAITTQQMQQTRGFGITTRRTRGYGGEGRACGRGGAVRTRPLHIPALVCRCLACPRVGPRLSGSIVTCVVTRIDCPLLGRPCWICTPSSARSGGWRASRRDTRLPHSGLHLHTHTHAGLTRGLGPSLRAEPSALGR